MTSTNLGDAPNLSPYLFLSLVVLAYNLIFTLTGVAQNAEDPLEDGIAQGKQIAYSLFLTFFLLLCGISLAVKHIFLYRKQKRTISCHRCYKMIEALVYDVTFVLMGTLYLAGDNLPIFICSSLKDTKDREACRGRSSFILGVSLLLHTALYLVGTLKLKSFDLVVISATGRIMKAYQSILQLVSLTIFIDQTFSTVERFITHLDIEDDETPNCGCVGNATADKCLSIIDVEVGGYFAGLFSIILFIVLGLFVKNWKDYCSCCWIKMKSKTFDCCCHLWENVFISACHCLVIVFMVLYTLADNRWLWKCVKLPDPTPGRVAMLVITLAFSLIWIGMYFAVICLPVAGMIWKTKTFFNRYEYAVIEARMDGSEWVRENVLAQPASSQPPGNTADYALFSTPLRAHDLTQSCGDFKIEEGYRCASFSLPLEEDTTCRKDLAYVFKRLCGCCKCCNGSTNQSGEEETQSSSAKEPAGDITCWEWLKSKCKCQKEKCLAGTPKARFSSQTREEEDRIFFAYIGNRENVRAAVVHTTREGKLELQMSEKVQTYPANTQVWVITKPSTSEPERRLEEIRKETSVQACEEIPQNGGSPQPSSLNGDQSTEQPPDDLEKEVVAEVEKHNPHAGVGVGTTEQ